jgi:extracellular factor (EF) 3-hydroxypalmitic acid methyl ester biosynthesis protein
VANARNPSNLITFRNSQGVQARGSLMKLSRTTLIFEVYNPYSIVQLSEILNDLVIRRGEQVVYKGRAVVSNLVNTGLMLIVSARLIDSWSELAGLQEDTELVRDEVETFVTEWRTTQSIRPEYQLSVSRIRSFLTELSRWLEHLDVQDPMAQPDGPDISEDFFATLSEPLLPPLAELFYDFEQQAARIDEDERMAHMSYAQYDLHPLLLRAPFVYRAFQKPLGYAGDYEMVNMMLRESREGPTVYAQIINSLYLGTGPAEAHRNRIDILVDWLRERIGKAVESGRQPRILNIGCGPAVELQRLFRTEPMMERADITLVDFSEETLAYTKERLRAAASDGRLRPNVTYSHDSVHRLLKRASGEDQSPPEPYDIVYCAGLFDYLSDRICQRLLRLFTQWTVPGGEILATNVHPSNPARHWMEHLLEWYLIYRDEKQMEQLADELGRHEVFVDKTGVNVFLRIYRDPSL